MTYAGITEISTFEVVERTATHCRLSAGSNIVPEPVDGVILEAQFSVGTFDLLVLSDDCPYEEVLHFRLLDASQRAADGLDFGATCAPAVFALVEMTDAPGLTFRFGGDSVYELVVHRSPRRWLRSSIRGAKHRGGWLNQRHLELLAA